MSKKQCYLCDRLADTYDHIPPKSFFPKPFPPNLLTVPCCSTCNNNLSQLDEKMRVFLAADEHANESAKRIRSQKIFTENSIKGRPFRSVASSLKTFPIKVRNFLTLGHTLSAPAEEIYHFVERIVRGLVYEFYPEVHNPKAFVLVECISTVAFKDAKNSEFVDSTMEYLARVAPRMKHDCFGDGVLDFLHQRASGGTAWIISFYRGATFMATQSPNAPSLDPNLNPHHG